MSYTHNNTELHLCYKEYDWTSKLQRKYHQFYQSIAASFAFSNCENLTTRGTDRVLSCFFDIVSCRLG